MDNKETKRKIIRMEILALSKVINSYDSLIEAAYDCYSCLEDLNSDLFTWSNLPTEFDALGKMSELLSIKAKLEQDRLKASSLLSKVEEEDDRLQEENNE